MGLVLGFKPLKPKPPNPFPSTLLSHLRFEGPGLYRLIPNPDLLPGAQLGFRGFKGCRGL